MRHFLKFFLIIFFLVASLPVTAQVHRLEIFILKNRNAEELIPLLRPLAGNSTVLTGMGDKIAIKGTEDEISQFRKLLEKFDVAPRIFLIRVRHEVTRRARGHELETSGRVTVDNGVRLEASGNASAGATESKSADSQQIKVLEGTQGFIQTGMSLPVKKRSTGGQKVYNDVSTGFYVLPRKAGDRVILEISPHRRTMARYGRVESNESSTVITAIPGEWIELGSSAKSASGKGVGTFYLTEGSSASSHGIFIMVTEVK